MHAGPREAVVDVYSTRRPRVSRIAGTREGAGPCVSACAVGAGVGVAVIHIDAAVCPSPASIAGTAEAGAIVAAGPMDARIEGPARVGGCLTVCARVPCGALADVLVGPSVLANAAV